MPHYLTIHEEPSATRKQIEARWVKLAEERRAIWVRTWYNFEAGKRFCWWDAPDRETLEEIFKDHGTTWTDICKVKLTTPSDWRWPEE
jgi:hypothetical protein